jgi:phosphoribosylamine--glycine ligase
MEKKNFLFASLTGLISDIAWQVAKEGHEVRYFIGDKKERDIGDGFVAKSKDWEKDVDWADIVIFDDTLGQGEKAQALRSQGKKVGGGTAYSDRLEDDRSFGQEELKKAGVNIIPYGEFVSFDDAVEHVVQNPGRYVIKPSGEAQNVKRRLFVGEEDDGQDVIRMLEAYKKALSEEIKVFQLQRRVTGVEVRWEAFSTAKISSIPSTSISSTRSFSPAISARPQAKWEHRCSGAARTSCSIKRCSRWSRCWHRKAALGTST